jgi:hypothetical protein
MKEDEYNLESLTFEQYNALEDKDVVDVILANVKPCKTLKTSICDVNPRKNSFTDFSLKEVIWFKNKFQSGDIEDVLHYVYGIKTTESCDIYSITGVVKWLEAEMLSIYKNEERLSSNKDSDTWRQAGIERLGGFGEYNSLFMLTRDITKEDQILEMPYYRIFDFQEITKVWSEIEQKYNKIKSEEN